ncbi:MarR family winged helix-turn-helix transcriptional regulator [Acuticoccus mangrovi]|uniref:Winged helix DNA-binding protein n=1 Tax=Acuticoccus mangrovi TaxID=2796142 RepID=A0A934IQZ9_9HYPH|nr:MarR family transcriptional regulator [Acuticoccus mangrovi]MBJ3777023.1 winged helix DNA-binding protein [Acuticoccus mangrovi]
MKDDTEEPRADAATAVSQYDVTEQVGYLLRRAYHRHLAIFQANCRDPQLTAVQFTTLCALRSHGRQSQAELVKATGVDQATIRGIVDRLKARDLVAISKDPADGRKVIIGITDAGLTLLETMVPRAVQATADTLDPLNPAERVALLYTLRKLADLDGK